MGDVPRAGVADDQRGGGADETLFSRTVVPFIDDRYRTAGPQRRAIAGFSLGGLGAMGLAAKHPDLFAAAASRRRPPGS